MNKLKDELTNAKYADMTDEEVAESLNALTQTKLVPITSAELLAWSGTDGRLSRIEVAQTDEDLPTTVQCVAKVAYRMICRDGTSLDLSKDDRVAMLAALVAYDVLTADDKASLIELATVPISRATELEHGFVYPGHIQNARM